MNGVGSLDTLGSMQSLAASQSLLDQVSVREIMDTCSTTIGGVGKSIAKKELAKITDEKNKTDDAMDRLKMLFGEYCDQLFAP